MTEPPLIYLVAGEASGDALGGRLMTALGEATGGRIRFEGVGGRAMTAAGLESRFPMSELSLMGAAEIIPHIPKLLRRMTELVTAMSESRPAALVTIDAPAFNWRLARRAAPLGVPRIHYVAPQVWAWRPRRARKIARSVDHLMTLLPFEPPYFTRYGCAATFVGHPVIESGLHGDGRAFRRAHGIAADAPTLVVLPGSRRGEVERLIGVFGEAARRVAARHPRLRVIVPTVEVVETAVRAAVADWPGQPIVTLSELEKFGAFAAADAALAASGTVSLELALCGCPTVVAYRMNAVTMAMARRFASVRWVSLANILLEREVIPEFLQERCAPEPLADALLKLFGDPSARAAQTRGFRLVAELLGVGGPRPSARAASVVLAAAGLG